MGGHVARGCIIRTTAEILVALLPDYAFSREPLTGVRGSGQVALVMSDRA